MTIEQTVEIPEYAVDSPVFLQFVNRERALAEFRLPEGLRPGKTKVEVTVTSAQPKPVFGCLKGKIHMADDFDEPLEDFKEYM